MNVDNLMARLGPSSFSVPDGARRDVSDPKQTSKTLAKVRRALGLRKLSGDSATRSHGTATRSYDLSAMSPQDIAAAVAFIKDDLARELFCIARWPGYVDRHPDAESNAYTMLLRKMMDRRREIEERHEEEWASAPSRGAKHRDSRKREEWPSIRSDMYKMLCMVGVSFADGGGFPSGRVIAKACGIEQAAYFENWRVVTDWVESEIQRMQADANRQFAAALK